MRMFENQLERDIAVLNADDPEVTKRMPAKPHIFWFSRQKRVAAGAFLRESRLFFAMKDRKWCWRGAMQISLRGEHNVENVLAACAAAYLAGATPAAIASGVKTFRGVEHRLEFVAEIAGVQFYNDSKATNVDAAVKAIEAFPGPLIVILGGKDKGSPYTPLRELLQERARVAILIGAAAEKIAADLSGAVEIEQCRNTRPRGRDGDAKARSRAIRCCWRRRARVSISLRITSTAGASSRNWWRGARRNQRQICLGDGAAAEKG